MSENGGMEMSEEDFDQAIRAAKAAAWTEGCKKGLGTNPGWEDEALAANPYRPTPSD